MVGIVLNSESIVRVGDKIRLDASPTTYVPVTPSITIASVTIKPEATAPVFNVTGSPVNKKGWFVDYFYSTHGVKTVTVEVTLSDSTVSTKTFSVTVLSEADDKLLVDDSEFRSLDFELMRFIPDGYSSWRHVHRRATAETLFFINALRLKRYDGQPLGFDEVNGSRLARQFATLTSLSLIYQQLSNKPDDKFYQRYLDAKKSLEQLKATPDWVFDFDGDGELTSNESADLLTGRLLRE
jgi:hypothetical protein